MDKSQEFSVRRNPGTYTMKVIPLNNLAAKILGIFLARNKGYRSLPGIFKKNSLPDNNQIGL